MNCCNICKFTKSWMYCFVWFDFNVIIRSLFYNQQSQYLSCMVGGAITMDSDPESEYQECLIKAKSVFKVLGQWIHVF